MNVTKAILRELVGKNKIKEVFKELLDLPSDYGKLNEVTLLYNQFVRIDKAYNHEKVLGQDAFDIEHNRIVKTILIFIDEIPDNTPISSTSKGEEHPLSILLKTDVALTAKTKDMENATLQELVKQVYKYETEKQKEIVHAKKEKEMKELIAASLHDVVVNLKEGALRSSGLPVAQFLGSMVTGLFGKSKKSEKLINAVEKEGELQLTTTEFEDEVLEIAKSDPQVTELLNKLYNSRLLEKIQFKANLIAVKSKEIKSLEKKMPLLTSPVHSRDANKKIDLLDIEIEEILDEIKEIFKKNGLSL